MSFFSNSSGEDNITLFGGMEHLYRECANKTSRKWEGASSKLSVANVFHWTERRIDDLGRKLGNFLWALRIFAFLIGSFAHTIWE